MSITQNDLNPLSAAASNSSGISPYNGPAVMVFSIIGLILQAPVIYTHCGLFGVPNIPVVMMSIYYVYLMLSLTMSAAHWSSSDISAWWDGKIWCDLDTRLKQALALGVLSAQCVINLNIIGMLRFRPQRESRQKTRSRILWQLAACLALPILNISVSTFTSFSRYTIFQGVGCSPQSDASVAIILTNFMWTPILGAVAFFTILFIAYRFWRQGASKTMQQVSFVPNMTRPQFFRIVLFACVITFVLMPLSLAVAAINFNTIASVGGVQDLAWKNGKPDGWEQVTLVTFADLAAGVSSMNANVTVALVILYVNIGIAWLIFISYGTGVVAIKAYKTFLVRIFALCGFSHSAWTDSLSSDDNEYKQNYLTDSTMGNKDSEFTIFTKRDSQSSESPVLPTFTKSSGAQIVMNDDPVAIIDNFGNTEWNITTQNREINFKEWEAGYFQHQMKESSNFSSSSTEFSSRTYYNSSSESSCRSPNSGTSSQFSSRKQF